MYRQALILAAGLGSRLKEATNGRAKCLVEIDGTPLIQHHLNSLRGLGVDHITVVVGHDAERVRAIAGDSCEFIVNEDYADTNSLYSLFLARRAIKGGFLMMNADVLAPRELFRRVIAHDRSALAYDSRSGVDAEHMKVEVVDGTLRAISKELPQHRTMGENIGIMWFDQPTAQLLFDVAGQLASDGQRKTWAPAAVGRVAEQIPFQCIDVAGLPWVEIDFPEDLAAAREHVWPAIVADSELQRRTA